jgi:hypothetical protein
VTDDARCGENLGRDLGQPLPDAIDFAFLSTQTLNDRALEREVLALYVAQVEDVASRLHGAPAMQADTAHLLAGSSRGIGAWQAAAAATHFEAASLPDRAACLATLTQALAAACAAARMRLAELQA